MEQNSYAKKWNECLDIIRKKCGEKYRHWYDVWFGDVRFDSYDEQRATITLRVPSKYVFEFLESNGMKTLEPSFHDVFGDGISLAYRITPHEPTTEELVAYLQRQGTGGQTGKRYLHVENARQRMEELLRYHLKDKPMQWLKGYDRVASWLEDNHGRGLICVGTSGLGKSLICQKVLPALINGGMHVAFANAMELHDRLEELKRERIVVIDDLGKEPRKHYGDTDQSFYELCDNAERTGALLIITTNLSTNITDDPRFKDSIQNRYGNEVYYRLQTITHVAIFEGKSLRE